MEKYSETPIIGQDNIYDTNSLHPSPNNLKQYHSDANISLFQTPVGVNYMSKSVRISTRSQNSNPSKNLNNSMNGDCDASIANCDNVTHKQDSKLIISDNSDLSEKGLSISENYDSHVSSLHYQSNEKLPSENSLKNSSPNSKIDEDIFCKKSLASKISCSIAMTENPNELHLDAISNNYASNDMSKSNFSIGNKSNKADNNLLKYNSNQNYDVYDRESYSKSIECSDYQQKNL